MTQNSQSSTYILFVSPAQVRDSYINDDLADEVEAIRLAADFTSRRLLSEQRRDRRDSVAVSAASASRLRIRSLLDKQKTVRVSSEQRENRVSLSGKYV